MKSTFTQRIAIGAALLASPLARAALDPAIVPADAQWVVFADLDGLRGTAIGKNLITLAEQHAPAAAGNPVRADVEKILATIGSVTGFGANLSHDPKSIDGALIFQGRPELRTIADGLLTQFSVSHPEDVTETKDLPFPAYSLRGEVIVGLPPEPIIIVSKSKARLVSALDVFRRKGPSLARSHPLAPMLPNEPMFFALAASIVPGEGMLSGETPQARILQMARSASVAVGEDAGLATVRVLLNASSEDMAEKLRRIVEGLVAMASLAQTDDQQLRTFINSAKVERADTLVRLDLAYPTEGLLQLINQIGNRARAGGGSRGPSGPSEPPPVEGNVVAQWVADQDLGSEAVSAENVVTKTIEGVPLQAGTMIILAGRRHDGEHARFDYLEARPAGGDRPQRFEAEFMRLDNYNIEKAPPASGGELIRLADDSGTARLRFPGEPGTYTLVVAYVDENDGRSAFSVSTLDPAAMPAVEKPATPGG